MTQNENFASLCIPLPPDIARCKEAGELERAIRLIDARLERGEQPELAARLQAERMRLERLPNDFPYDEDTAKAMLRREWTDMTDAQFERLMDGGRIDWRYRNGQRYCQERFVESLRLYPLEAPGLRQERPLNREERDAVLARMREQGGVTARVTLRAWIRAKESCEGKEVQAWLPVPAACPQQTEIEVMEATPGGICGPEDAPQRTIWWKGTGTSDVFVTYRYRHHAAWVDPMTIVSDPVQPDFDTEEQAPHILFTPYLRALAARITEGCSDPMERARAIYDYVTGHVDYRYQPAYIHQDNISDGCARELRGDCGVMALLFITLCRIAGIPARWQSGLAVRPGSVGSHDWAMFYIAPHGWLWADCSFGSSARRNGEEERRRHYFGNLDPWRMVANNAFYAPLTPPDPAWRQDPYDNQRGEMMIDGRGLDEPEMERGVELLDFELL